jgi:hypothetical protein
MQRTITLTNIIDNGSLIIRFDDKEFGSESLQVISEFSEQELQDISGRLLRSLLIIEYVKQQRLPISATIDTNNAGQIITING